MIGHQNLRPTLYANGRLIGEFMAAARPCCAWGILEEGRKPSPFMALRPSEAVVPRRSVSPLHHGDALWGLPKSEVIQFGLKFFEQNTYHVLVNPNNPVIKAVLSGLIERGHYFVFVVDAANNPTTFRADLDPGRVAKFSDYLRRAMQSTTSLRQYDEVVAQFRQHPSPPGEVLEWVCRDNADYLDYTQHRLVISPDD